MKSPKLVISMVAAIIVVAIVAYMAGTGNLHISWNATAPTESPSTSLKPEASAKPSTAASPSVAATGTITGTVGFPSEGLPKDMKVCAENQATQIETCTSQITMVNTPQPHPTYTLDVPPGKYLVYAIVPSFKADYRAYYNAFVTCGLKYECKDHTPIVVDVMAGKTATGIDPQDWYNTQP
jgi:hypothetical protein